MNSKITKKEEIVSRKDTVKKVPIIINIGKAACGTQIIDYTGITLIEPLDYLAFLQLESKAKIVLTDSGGVQEETCIRGVPCVTLRENRERP
jgi:UDP-N-acetylglucosamine 2-epimerase